MKYRRIIGLAILTFALTGCHKEGPKSAIWPPFASNSSGPQIHPSVLQQELMSFADRFSSAIADVYDQAADTATSPQVKEFALSRKTGNLTAAISNCVDDNPIVGLLDMLVMTSLTRATTEDPWFKEIFGESAARITAVHRSQEDEIWGIAKAYLFAAQLAELRESIDRWRAEHRDQRYVAMVRLSDFSRTKNGTALGTNNAGSVFSLLFLDPFASLDPAVREVERSRETAQRMFYYLQRMPSLVAWQAELSARRSLAAPQIDSFLGDTSKFTDSTLKFANATGAVADSIKGYPQFLTEERQRAVDQASQKITEQRDAAIQQLSTAVSTERDAAIKQIAAAVTTEREAAINQATTRASVEGNAILEHFNSLLQSQRTELLRETDASARGLIDRILWGQVIVILIGVVAAVIGALIYRAIRPHN